MKPKILCRIFGHNPWKWEREYAPHYLDLVKRGLVGAATPTYDYCTVRKLCRECQRCGIDLYTPPLKAKE